MFLVPKIRRLDPGFSPAESVPDLIFAGAGTPDRRLNFFFFFFS